MYNWFSLFMYMVSIDQSLLKNKHGQISNNTDLVLLKWLVVNVHSVFKDSTPRILMRVKTKSHT